MVGAGAVEPGGLAGRAGPWRAGSREEGEIGWSDTYLWTH